MVLDSLDLGEVSLGQASVLSAEFPAFISGSWHAKSEAHLCVCDRISFVYCKKLVFGGEVGEMKNRKFH